MITDIIDSAKQNILERLSSPLISGFVVSWALWNWKFLVILLSNNTVTTTFELIERTSFPNIQSIIIQGIILPLGTALAYVFIYPYPARFIYEFTLKRQREINQARQRISEETPLTLEESRKIRSEYINQDRHNKDLIDQLNQEVNRLTNELEEIRKLNAPTTEAPKEPQSTQLAPWLADILMELEQLGGATVQSTLISRSKESKIKTEFDIGELEKKKFISRTYSPSKKDHNISFTHEGRGALLNYKSTTA
jgi:hypothetical protein